MAEHLKDVIKISNEVAYWPGVPITWDVRLIVNGSPAPALGFRAKKIPTEQGWDFWYWWRRRESNPRPQVLCPRIYMRIPSFVLLAATRRAGKTDSQSSGWALT